MAQVIALASGLLQRGAAYQRDGQVYFRGADVPERAGLDRQAALRLAEEYGDRPGDLARDDPFDVPVWQSSTEGEPAWDSPWGAGRPGWHAECAAMALDAFGAAVDVQSGGGDLRFPHHAYQAAMAEALTGVTPFARARLQAPIVGVGGAKMAKSTGNLVLVKDLLANYPAAAIRLLILDRHWQQDWDYDQAGLEAAAARLERLSAAATRPRHTTAGSTGVGSTGVSPAGVGSTGVGSTGVSSTGVSSTGYGSAAHEAINAALADDLNVPTALAIAEEEGGQAAQDLGAFLGLW
jgi:cysteinyl-tRNA synthetase